MGKRTSRPSFFRRYGLAILIGTGVMLPLIGMGSLRAMRSNRNEVKSWLPAAYEETATFDWYWKHFESDAFILASWDGCTLDSPELPQIATKLRADIDAAKKAGTQFFFGRVNTGAGTAATVGRRPGYYRRGRSGAASRIGRRARWPADVSGVDDRLDGHCGLGSRPGPGRPRPARVPARRGRTCLQDRRRVWHRAGSGPSRRPAGRQRGHRRRRRTDADEAGCHLRHPWIGLSWWSLRSWRLTAIVCTTAVFSAGVSLALVWISGAHDERHPDDHAGPGVRGGDLRRHPPGQLLSRCGRQATEFGARPIGRSAEAWLPLGLATGTTAIGLVSLASAN